MAGMRVHNALVDDDGQKWDFYYRENIMVPVLDPHGEPVLDQSGAPRLTSTVTELSFRKEGDEELLTLPSWADIREEQKISLCMFDEDEDGEMTFWEIS